jgi:hypothetical protein
MGHVELDISKRAGSMNRPYASVHLAQLAAPPPLGRLSLPSRVDYTRLWARRNTQKVTFCFAAVSFAILRLRPRMGVR